MNTPTCSLFAAALVGVSANALASDPLPSLERLKYNHPGLTVDLGVGLWASPLPMDFNGDGQLDLVVACHDKPYHGVYVFEKRRAGSENNTMPVFMPPRRISKGLPEATVSVVDGKARVLVGRMAFPDFLNTGLENPIKFEAPPKISTNPLRSTSWHLADLDGDGNSDLIIGADDWSEYGWDNAYSPEGTWTHGPLRGYVYWLRNAGSNQAPSYQEPQLLMAGSKQLETYGRPHPCFADFRGTGKLDLICGEFLDGFTYFENKGTPTTPEYAPGRPLRLADGTPLTIDLEMTTPTAIDWNQDGKPDLLVGDEDGRVAFIENTGTQDASGAPIFNAARYFQQEADELKCGALATPVGVDWDGDGSMDLISGNSAGYIQFFKNLSAPGVEKPKWAAPKYLEADGKVIRFMAGPNGSIQGPAEAKWGYTTLSVSDWDGDGLPDLIVNSIWGKVVWFKNIGTRTEPELAAPQPIEVEWDGPQPTLAYGWLHPEGKALLTQWRTTPFTVDWNHDGLKDLIMLDQEGYLAFFERANRDGKLVLLAPKRVFCDELGNPLQLAKRPGGHSGRRKFCLTDWDRDGKVDILLNSSNAELWRQVDARDGKWFFKNMGSIAQDNLAGHDVSPTVVDFNGDGIPDLLCGAEDGHFYYLKNPHSK